MESRERREARIHHLAGAANGCVVAVSVSIPGLNKNLPGAGTLVAMGAEVLAAAARRTGLQVVALQSEPTERPDPLGPFRLLQVADAPAVVKSLCTEVEEGPLWGRLLDLDVYEADGNGGIRQIGRAALGQPARACLLCAEPARECILLRRHSDEELARRARAGLAAARRGRRLRLLADALVRGARAELDLTPKPGLVDRFDHGSHPDLSYLRMRGSIDLLQVYYRELIAILERAGDDRERTVAETTWRSCVAAGRAAEERMYAAVGANAHRGYIFLSGLVLLAAAEAGSTHPARLRPVVTRLAARFFDAEPKGEALRPGQRLRHRGDTGGIEGEARAGLPAIFEAALPAWRRYGSYGALAALMLRVEDTTALHRAGRSGLDRIRRDGARLRALLARGEDPVPNLELWNEEYRAIGLTMGGVADCLGLTLALAGRRFSASPLRPVEEAVSSAARPPR